MKKNSIIILILCAVLALVLRVYKLGELPLYGDELTMVYDSYSILKTGHDQLGNPWPLTFEMGAGRPAGYVYASIPFVALFGPTAYGVRGLSILSGLGIVVLMYFLGKKLFNEKVGLIASFMVALAPWDISLSRGGFEAHFALFLALLGVTLLFYANRKPWFYILSAFAFGLTLVTYPTYKLVLPLFLIFLFAISSDFKRLLNISTRKYLVGGILVFVFFLVVSYTQTFLNQSETRFFNINLFADGGLRENIVQEINFERTISEIPQGINQFFHNKPLKYGTLLFKGYLDSFSFDFLFINGDGNPRHNMTAFGEFYWVEILLIFGGILTLYRKSPNKIAFLLGWLLLAPLATALILIPHALRNAFMFPPLLLLSAVGIEKLFAEMKFMRVVKLFVIVLSLGWIIEFTLIVNNLYFVSPNKYSQFWSYSARKAVIVINERSENYDYIFLSSRIDNAEYAYQVYNKINPSDVISQRDFPEEFNNLRFKNFGKVYIGTIPENSYQNFFSGFGDKKILYLANFEEKGTLQNYEVFDTPSQLPGFIVKSF